jgi:hypothetical protein
MVEADDPCGEFESKESEIVNPVGPINGINKEFELNESRYPRKGKKR